MYSPIKLSVKGSDLKESLSFNFNFSTPSHFLAKCTDSTNLINITSNIRYFSGFVKSKDCSPIINAIIAFTSIQYCNITNNKEISRTFTTTDGAYGFTLNINEYSTYLFSVYSPLQT